MAFKMSYSFEGNLRTKPEQNLSGASKKMSRDFLLQKTHEERRKRQEQRLKLQSAEKLQSHIRSYLVRKQIKTEQRALFDRGFDTNNTYSLLSKLLFFYDSKLDNSRLLHLSQGILQKESEVKTGIARDSSVSWLVKRWLVLCLRCSRNDDMLKTVLTCLERFINNVDIIDFIVRKGYYNYMRYLLDNSAPNLIEDILNLIYRPFQSLKTAISLQDMIMSEFALNFLQPKFTNNIKTILIPFLRNKEDFPYENMIHYLNSGYNFHSSNSLFYCILALEPDDHEPSPDSIEVLAKLSADLHELKPPVYLVMDDSDDEEDITVSEEDLLLSDYINIMNKPEKVRRLLHFIDHNCHLENVLISVAKLCHNLLLVYKESIRKYLLLYKLGLNGNFLNKLWGLLQRTHYLESDLRGASLLLWKECHMNLSVFCDMFRFYTETLTDRENSDTSETFTSHDLYSMAKLLRTVAIDLLELAFPMCRTSTIRASPNMLHLYSSCLNCLKMLYMLDMRKQFCAAGFWTGKKIHISPDLARKNYLTKTIQPFHGVVNDDDEDNLPPLSTIEQRSLAILQELPFLISFNTRVLLLRDLSSNCLGGNDYQRTRREFSAESLVVIRRTHLYEDAFNKLSVKNETDLRYKVRIQFINNVGLEEAGVDGGGIFKEFINEVLKTAFDPNRGFFLMTADNTLYPNPNVHLIVENFTEHYYFIGRLVGKAIFENILVDLPLAEFFLAKLLVDRTSAHYLKSLDPVLYRNLLYLRDYVGDVSDLGLDFTTLNNDLGETRVMDLKPNGSNIPVTNDNRLEYIQRLADLKLNVQLKKQCAAFREGLDNVVPLLWLKLFNHKELQVIIGGDNQEIDLSDMKAHTVYGGEFDEDHPTILLFWRILNKFTESQKKMLLKFVTSCSRPPLLGFKELNPQFCIQSSGRDDRMPTASTCLNLLKIPIIKEEEVLKNKLLAAIEQQAGFELS